MGKRLILKERGFVKISTGVSGNGHNRGKSILICYLT